LSGRPETPRPRPELTQLDVLAPPIHGGAAPPSVLDFSTGISPFPAPAAILEAARAADLGRYPHPSAAPLCQAVAELHGVPVGQVVAGAGSVELIWALARAFGGPGRRGTVLAPAFGEYERALRACGTEVDLVRAIAPDFAWSLPGVAELVAARAPTLLFVCRPSNPCLSSVPGDFVPTLAERFPGTLIVVDEAFLPMFEGVEPVVLSANVVVLRSLTKLFALAGLRVGYLLAPAAVAAAVQACLPPWNLSAPAQAAGVVAARLVPHQAASIRAGVAALRRSLIAGLGDLDLRPLAQGGPFALFAHRGADAFCGKLAARGAQLRSLTSLGLPDVVRVGVRPDGEQKRLVEIWRDLPAARQRASLRT
jgi:histidinol-phosphate/aromatic aminotransferase/cobyric acid decarboxylase-like protein